MRHLVYEGRDQSIAAWGRERGLKVSTISMRLAKGESIAQALRPSRPRRAPAQIEIGARFGHLVVVGRSEKRSSRGEIVYRTACDCKAARMVRLLDEWRAGKLRAVGLQRGRARLEQGEAYPGRKLLSGEFQMCFTCRGSAQDRVELLGIGVKWTPMTATEPGEVMAAPPPVDAAAE